MVSIIRSLHEGMQARGVRIGDGVTGNCEVRNGLWQGCVIGPNLFNIYFNAMVAGWHD